VSRNEIQTQAQLVELLAAEGITSTQATLSRDLRELGIRKLERGYGPVARANSGITRRRLAAAIGKDIVRAERAGQFVVVHTQPGTASQVSAEITGAGLQEVVGAIAGTDTVFVATPSAGHARTILKVLVD
jgi:transcriptional regulator of arginine metabolism